MNKLVAATSALVAGLILPFSFAPYNLWWIAITSPAVFVVIVKLRPLKESCLIGWLYGIGFFGGGVSWIHISLYQFGIPSYFFSIGMTGLFVALIAIYFLVYAWVLKLFLHRGIPLALIAPALWVLIEYLRGSAFTGFPWLILGYSQIDSILSGYIPVFGALGCSWIVLTLSSLLAACFCVPTKKVSTTIFFVGVLLLSGWGFSKFDQTYSDGTSLDVALVQGAVPQRIKWHESVRDPSILHYRKLTAEYWGIDLIIWPETAIPAFGHEVTDTISLLASKAAEEGSTLIFGLPTIGSEGVHYNSLMAVGENSGIYHKRHLVPLGEYFPLGDYARRLLKRLSIPMSDFAPGSLEQPGFYIGDKLVGLSICYEVAFSSLILRSMPTAKLLINVSNDAWFGRSIAQNQHLQVARVRALESGRYLLRATNNGITAVIDDKGQVVDSLPQFAPGTLRSTIELKQGSTIFVKFGIFPLLLVIFTVFFLTGSMRLFRGKNTAARALDIHL
jgi:apolipoprotein N-acyltransferase